MAENDTGATPGTDATSEQVEATPNAETAQQPATGSEDAEQQLGDAGREILRAARREAKEAKDALKVLQKQLPETEQQSIRLSELERANSDLQQRLQERTLNLAVRDLAPSLGIPNVRLAALAIDRAAVEYDANGDPKNLKALLDRAIQEYPELAPGNAAPVTRGVQAGTTSQVGGFNEALRRAAGVTR